MNLPVPVGLWTSTALPPLITDESSPIDPTSTTSIADPTSLPEHGCNIDGQFYMDGMQVDAFIKKLLYLLKATLH